MRRLLFLFLLVVLFGCNRTETPAKTATPPLSQPPGPQIGRTDSLMNATAPRLLTWVTMWRAALPEFETDSLWVVGRARWTPRIEEEGFSVTGEGSDDVAPELLVLPSPSGSHVLYIDRYQVIVPHGDTIEVGGEPDSRSDLVDQRTDTVALLRSCGTPCGSHWGTWLSPTAFALAGWQDADDYSQWKQGTLSIYSITDSTVATYATRVVSTEQYVHYVQAWETWLLSRYQALSGRLP